MNLRRRRRTRTGHEIQRALLVRVAAPQDISEVGGDVARTDNTNINCIQSQRKPSRATPHLAGQMERLETRAVSTTKNMNSHGLAYMDCKVSQANYVI